MGDHDITPTCLSAEPHKARDHLLHYTGCEEFHNRSAYLGQLEIEQAHQIEHELRRISYLRSKIGTMGSNDKNLIDNLGDSLTLWRGTDDYKDGLEQVKKWRALKRKLPNGQQQPEFTAKADPTSDYNPDLDIKAHFLKYEHLKPGSDPVRTPGPQSDQSQDNGLVGEHFVTQKIPVADLLDPTKPSALKRTLNQHESIKYFHLPANNMLWVEKAIARYFGEKDLAYDGIFQDPSEKNRTEAYMVLRPDFWTGQQHGGRSSQVHARHLRPMCETVSSDPKRVQASPRNIVLFMPYMHWETDRQREQISQFVDAETDRHRMDRRDKEQEQKSKRQTDRGDLEIPWLKKKGNEVVWEAALETGDEAEPTPPGAPARTLTSIFSTHMDRYKRLKKMLKSRIFRKEKGRILAGSNVGQILFDAAMLYEAMSIFRDKMILHKYLHESPPLHPRRTLDQAYYWTLKTTKSRDQDQVVYRGTRADPKYSHSIDPDSKMWNCQEQYEEERLDAAAKMKAKKQREAVKEDRENKARLAQAARQCIHCRDAIRKVSRVIMVDQLWMWILDEGTIITCFPKRYGVNKQDPSGVHKAIRSRLKNLRKDHIRTVFDLALIILDETSNTFFDRTKTKDRQPQVMDIFSEAIGKIVSRLLPTPLPSGTNDDHVDE